MEALSYHVTEPRWGVVNPHLHAHIHVVSNTLCIDAEVGLAVLFYL